MTRSTRWSSAATTTRRSARGRPTSGGSGHVLRFIEYLDAGATNGWRLDYVVPAAELIALIGEQWPSSRSRPAIPARSRPVTATRTARARSASSPRSPQPFCRSCTRARLSAKGKLHTFLFAGSGHDLRYAVFRSAKACWITAAVTASGRARSGVALAAVSRPGRCVPPGQRQHSNTATAPPRMVRKVQPATLTGGRFPEKTC
jgi:hypothetical protein